MKLSPSAPNVSASASPQNVVRIGVVASYVKACWIKLPRGGVCPNVDYEFEFVVMLMRALNWSYVFVPTDEYGYQHPDDPTLWNGLARENLF